ncbi:transposase [Streptomyces sp. NPDC093071]|uniref:transposase n=1 Tax=Streptomyces sp. NPDC093071 TaxID=3366022 RepID=UPI0037F8AA10
MVRPPSGRRRGAVGCAAVGGRGSRRGGGRSGRTVCDHRQVADGTPFRVRAGVPWRDSPERCGDGKTACERRRRRSADGIRERICRAVPAGVDVLGGLDRSTVGVHPAPYGPVSMSSAPRGEHRESRKEIDVSAVRPGRRTRTLPGRPDPRGPPRRRRRVPVADAADRARPVGRRPADVPGARTEPGRTTWRRTSLRPPRPLRG